MNLGQGTFVRVVAYEPTGQWWQESSVPAGCWEPAPAASCTGQTAIHLDDNPTQAEIDAAAPVGFAEGTWTAGQTEINRDANGKPCDGQPVRDEANTCVTIPVSKITHDAIECERKENARLTNQLAKYINLVDDLNKQIANRQAARAQLEAAFKQGAAWGFLQDYARKDGKDNCCMFEAAHAYAAEHAGDTGWISVKDRLPVVGEDVLWNYGSLVEYGHLTYCSYIVESVTGRQLRHCDACYYWMPIRIPAPPKKEGH